MSFDARITRLPRPFDTERAQEAQVPGLSGAAAELVTRAAGCSPYIADLIRREADWLPDVMTAPEEILPTVWALDPLAPDLGSQLRQAKRRVALVTALADLGDVWALETVTGVLTDFADAACDLALKGALAPLIARGKLPGLTADDLKDAGGLVVFAMGKMGAHELNYSSDIDLICIFDETRFAPDDYATLRNGFARAVRQMCATLSDIGAEGYVFRTDLRLRPDPAVTPVVLSMGAAERYYESLGRTWERAAWIKARPAAGDLETGKRFQDNIRPFVWRKHLDFAAIQDAHDMRLAIRDAKGLAGPITLPGHDMKLGRGGIREIEFFTQTRQLIAGGRDPGLRVRGTIGGLKRLAERGWVEGPAARDLMDHYRFYRTVEHRLQMVRDAQTHALPRKPEEFARLAAMMDYDAADLTAELTARLEAVHEQTEGFFAPEAEPDVEPTSLAIERAVIERWRAYPSLRSERAQQLFDRILPTLAQSLAAATRPEEALAAFDSFLKGLPAGVQLFSLFEANPQLVELLLDILTIAPPLADYLARNVHVLDAVIGGDFFAPWPGAEALTEQLCDSLSEVEDYERKLDTVRRWKKEWHFRVGVHHLTGLTRAQEAGAQYADLARAVLDGLWPDVVAQFSQKHGPPPGRGAVLLGLGSLGAGHLSPSSDLDVIMIYDPLDQEDSDGRRPLPSRLYFARLTQALITAISAQTAEGRLYEIDMRLRPSGNQGPVATSWGAFQSYQQDEAWIWEHLALTRARVVAGAPDLSEDVAAFLARILALPRPRADVLAAVRDMRQRIAAAKSPASVWQPKAGPGALQDIELFVQAGALLQGHAAHDVASASAALTKAAMADARGVETLQATYRLGLAVQMATRLVAAEDAAVRSLGAGALGILLRAADAPDLDAAETRLSESFDSARHIIDAGLKAKDDTDGNTA